MLCLKTERLILKSLKESRSDLLSDFYLRNLDFLRNWIPLSEPEFYSPEILFEKIKKENSLSDKGSQISLYLFKKTQTDKITGNVSVLNINGDTESSGYLAFMIDKSETGNGFAREAAEKIIEYSFSELKLDNIKANVMCSNFPSLKTLEKLFFKKEKLLKNFIKINGRPEDHFLYVLKNNNKIQP